MKQIIKLTFFTCCLWLITGSCEKDTEPTWIAPEMKLELVAQSTISRTEATLKGNIGTNDLDITECGFAYSDNKTLLEKKAFADKSIVKVPVDVTSGNCTVSLSELEPGKNYFYCLYITCGNTTVISPEILQFTTTANNAPELTVVTIIEGQEIDHQNLPLQGKVVSVGSDKLSLCGFCYAKGAEKDPTFIDKTVSTDNGESDFAITISELEANTEYSVRAFAMNDKGILGYGEKTVFRTTNAEKPTVITMEDPEVRGSYAIVNGEVTFEGTGGEVTKRGFCWSSTNSSPLIGQDEFIEQEVNENKTFFHTITGLSEGTTYHIRAYASNSKGTSYGNKISITTGSVKQASVTIDPAFNITTVTAEITAAITNNGDGTIKRHGFCWSGSVQEPRVDASGCDHHDMNEGKDFKLVLTNLTPNEKQYWIVAYVENEKGISYSPATAFKTAVLDVATLEKPTVPPSSITINSASLNSSIVSNNNSDVTETGFCWSSTKNEPTLADDHAKADANFSLKLSDLKFGTTYYVRAYAKNSVGTGYSQITTFTTTNILIPSFNPLSISNVNASGAVVTTTITSANNGTVTEKGFCWSTTNNMPTIDDPGKHVITDNNTTFAYALTGLTNGTRYYVRAFATNEAGTSYTNAGEFTTVTLSVPLLASPAINSETTHSAYATSTIQNNGNSTVTERGFYWSSKNNQPDENNHEGTTTITGEAFGATMTELTFGKIYYVRAYAKNGVGTGYSTTATFTTTNILPPSFNQVTVSNINATGAILTTTISSSNNGTISEKGFCWSTTNPKPTIDDPGRHAIDDNHTTYAYALSGLTNGTRYYVRAYATNEAGTNYSDATEFTTTALTAPQLAYPNVNSVTVNSAYVSSSVQSNGNSTITERGFYWSSKTNQPNETNHEGTDKMNGENFSTIMTGLTFGKTYYVRAYAKNGVGTGYSEANSFATITISTPSMYSTTTSGITTTTATLSSSIYNVNNGTIKRKGFCWSTTQTKPTLDNTQTFKDIQSDVNSFSHTLTGLKPGTTYYVQAYAENEAGLIYNGVTSFMTDPVSVPTLGGVNVPSNTITITSAKATVRITGTGNLPITSAGFYWSATNSTPNGSPGDGKKVFDNPTSDLLEVDITGLKQNTTYYIRAFAINSEGTTQTNVVQFTTPIDPIPDDGDMPNPGN